MSLSNIFPTLRLLASRSVTGTASASAARPSPSLVRLFSVSTKILQSAADGLSPKSDRLFIGGLNFDTTQDRLREAFSKFEAFKDVTIISRNGRSKGFGYAEFSDADSAETALHEMNDSELDGFRLRLDFATARPGVSSRGGREPNAPTETVFIGNLPYTYDSTDLRQVLTEAMGGSIEGLQDVRLPPVPVMNDPINPFPEESVNKGFGFISFNSQEAAVAFKEALEAKIEQDGFTLHGEKVPRLDFAQAAAPRERSSYNNDRRSGGGFDDRRQSRGGYGGDRQSRGGYGGDRQSRGGYGGDRQSRGYGGDRQSRGYGGDRQSGGGFRRAREDYNDY